MTKTADRALPRHVYVNANGVYSFRFRKRGLSRHVGLGSDRAKALVLAGILRAELEIPKQDMPRQFAKGMFYSTLRNAKARGVENTLTIDDVLGMVARAGGRCEVSGIPFAFDKAKASRRPWIPSIDRIDCGVGYTPANCRLVCLAVNFAMNQWGLETLERIALAVRKRRKLPEHAPIGE